MVPIPLIFPQLLPGDLSRGCSRCKAWKPGSIFQIRSSRCSGSSWSKDYYFIGKSQELLKKIGICFLFAQNYHIAMKYVAPIRKELGIRTVFNILGPLSNPAGANMELMGVYDEALVKPLAQVMANLGVTRGMVVFGQDSLDEISMSAPTSVCEIKDGTFTSYVLTPEQFGYERCTKEELQGGTPQENAEITKAILEGKEKGVKRHAVCLNAGAALYIVGKAENIEAGVKLAEQLIDSGAALKKLGEFIEKSNEEN